MSKELVDVTNFVRAETNRMFAGLLQATGGVNQLFHFRNPTAVDEQTVIRMNRDTLYSAAIVDLTGGAELEVPHGKERYLSVMVVNQDHYINRIYHEPGDYTLRIDEFDTDYVLVAMRTFLDPSDPEDIAEANAVQDGLKVRAASAQPFEMPDYDEASFTAVRTAVLGLSKTQHQFDRAFGSRQVVDPIRHLLGTASGWGGLPETEATYINVDPGLPVGEYRIEVPSDVPVDAFWSISLYNAEGFFEENERGAYSVNSVTGTKNADGSMTVHLGGCGDDRANCLPVMNGWNYTVRLYRPRPAVTGGGWVFPGPERVS